MWRRSVVYMTTSLDSLCSRYADMSIDICRELIRRSSEDPPGDTRQIASYIYSLLLSHGINCKIVSPHPQKPSIIANIIGEKPGKHVVFNGHIDTFPVGDLKQWTVDPFGGELIDGKIFGRGSADMKGGVAASLTAAIILNQMKEDLYGKISVTCVSDEEVDGPWGSHYILNRFPDLYGDALINGEPSSMEHIRIGEKGIFQARIYVNTSGGHGAYTGLTHNAIKIMTNILANLVPLDEENLNVPPSIKLMMEQSRNSYEKILGAGATDQALMHTINYGTIHGGIMVNMVPEYCTAEIDCRFPPGVTSVIIEEWLNAVIRKFQSEADIRYTVIKRTDPYITTPQNLLVRIAQKCISDITGQTAFPNYSLGGTEAVLWRSHGVPAITYGPSHHNMGGADEYIFADELPQIASVHANIAYDYLLNTALL